MKFILLFLLINSSYASSNTDYLEIRLISEISNNIIQTSKRDFFISLVGPTVIAQKKIEGEKFEFDQIKNKLENAIELNSKEEEYLSSLTVKYQTKELEELELRINIIPIDLVFSQAALESGWGKSNMAIQCNNFFGLHSGSHYSTCNTPSKLLAEFSSMQESIEAYMLNFNRLDAYNDFRILRKKKIKANGNVFGVDLIPTLKEYSSRGNDYLKELSIFLMSNKLDIILLNSM